MTDPFITVRELARQRRMLQHEWSDEVKALHAAGYSLRAIAEAAGVAPDTVWRRVSG